MKKLGIVGHGFVGSAINQGFTKNVKKYVVDPNKFGSNTIQQLIKFKMQYLFLFQLHNWSQANATVK